MVALTAEGAFPGSVSIDYQDGVAMRAGDSGGLEHLAFFHYRNSGQSGLFDHLFGYAGAKPIVYQEITLLHKQAWPMSVKLCVAKSAPIKSSKRP